MYKFFSNVKIWFAISMMFLMTTSSLLNAQAPQDWFLKEYQVDKVYGVGAEKAYELLTGQKSVPVVVAVIDGGVEADHADLKNIMWVNKNEIPGNGKDDDKNGYIDDIHGWNFIGNKDGNNVHQDSYEVTRFYAANKARFQGLHHEAAQRAAGAGDEDLFHDAWTRTYNNPAVFNWLLTKRLE